MKVRIYFSILLLFLLGFSSSVVRADLLVRYTFEDITGDTTIENDIDSDLDGTLLGNAQVVYDAIRGSDVLALDGVSSSYVTIDDPLKQKLNTDALDIHTIYNTCQIVTLFHSVNHRGDFNSHPAAR